VAVSPAAKKAGKKPAAASPAVAPDELGGRLRAIVRTSIGAMEERVQKHFDDARGEPLTEEVLGQVMAIGEKAAVWMGHVRRSDEALRAAAKKISRAAAIEWARALPDDERESFVLEISGEEARGGVFDR
jgi:hypothetical protein